MIGFIVDYHLSPTFTFHNLLTLSESLFHPVTTEQTYVQVILPIAVSKVYTYSVPEEMLPLVKIGMRVEVEFGKTKHYAGIISAMQTGLSDTRQVKPILAILDVFPIVHEWQIKYWSWISSYYCCTIGEVMNAAIPGGLKLASETRIALSPLFDGGYEDLDDREFMIAEALSIQSELSLGEVRKILNQKSVGKIIQNLLVKRMIYLKEELQESFKPKKIRAVKIAQEYIDEPEKMRDAFNLLGKSNRQMEAMMALIDLSKKQKFVTAKEIYKRANVNSSVLNAMTKKGVIEIYEQEISRITAMEKSGSGEIILSPLQQAAFDQIEDLFEEKNVVLLHGITGSGKTEIYIELIKKAISEGKQCLYLLPEIGLTTQITERLAKVFGEQLLVYHSRLRDAERVETWNKVRSGVPLVLGVRSSLFLPFNKLDLVIIDEEHDASYKQYDPAPRYNGRDLGIYLGTLHQAKTILGSATPSLESYHNVQQGKYGLTHLQERYSKVELPSVEIIDLGAARKKKAMKSFFSEALITALEETLSKGQQAILFKNRRGFAPTMVCNICDWRKLCKNCDVSLTYHKFNHSLRCHYCGAQEALPVSCPACGSQDLEIKGFGTEKIEDELKVFLPDASIGRMDLDTVKGKNGFANIIHSFATGQIDILVGTQMVTKGLDFENVGLVGVLSADQLLYYPDFRAAERAFQMMTQVSGRAGRRDRVGRVLIQTYQPDHQIIEEVVNNDYPAFFRRELQERLDFHYPPFFRLIKVTLKHRDPNLLNEAAKQFIAPLKQQLGNRVHGPAIPGIARIRNQFILDILIKLERKNDLIVNSKALVKKSRANVLATKGMSGVRININIDPYS